jgi:hypothetical protein
MTILARLTRSPRLKRIQPALGDVSETRIIQDVHPLAPTLLDFDESGHLEQPQVVAGRRPGAPETIRDFTCCHLAASEMEDEENVPPGRMRQRAEDRVDIRQFPLNCTSTFDFHRFFANSSSSKFGKSISSQIAPIGSHTAITDGS